MRQCSLWPLGSLLDTTGRHRTTALAVRGPFGRRCNHRISHYGIYPNVCSVYQMGEISNGFKSRHARELSDEPIQGLGHRVKMSGLRKPVTRQVGAQPEKIS